MDARRAELLFDGACGYCRRWIERWRERFAAGGIACRPYQDALSDSAPPLDELSRAIHLIDSDGRVHRGAAAVFRAQAAVPGEGWRWWSYRRVPGFAPLAELGYRIVAANRALVSRVVRWTHGPDLRPIGYRRTRRVFVALLGAVYAIAFASLGVQVLGLIGSNGILPAAELVERARAAGAGVLRFPTVFRWGASDATLAGTCWLGAAAGVLVALGFAPRLLLAGMWIAYLSLANVSDVFLGYQWDALLLEVGLLAVFFAPSGLRPDWRQGREPSRILVFLLRWVLFRLVFLSGAVKLLSRGPGWSDGTALACHFETQPLPNALSHYAHHLPARLLRFGSDATIWVELGAPLLVFFPRRLRLVGAALLTGLLASIAATGDYGFFVPLSLALCALLLDDRALEAFGIGRNAVDPLPVSPLATVAGRARTASTALLALVVLLLTATAGLQRIERIEHADLPAWLRTAREQTRALRCFNAYGLFEAMTTERRELELEGSDDGRVWKPYVFRWKPGPLGRRPGWAHVHMPRLDWQMWFAALAEDWRDPGWYSRLCARLLEGSPQVLALLEENPFPARPPRFLRTRAFDYRFSTGEERERGVWWRRQRARPWTPELELREGRLWPAGS
jgi:predicted DCC family thiol-disulfide oxidoreductase YuxK